MRDCPYPLDDVDELVDRFCWAWGEFAGDEATVRRAMRDVVVTWHAGDTFADRGKIYRGATYSRKDVRVATREHLGLLRTALVHELCHVAFWAELNDPQRGHDGAWTKETEALILRLQK